MDQLSSVQEDTSSQTLRKVVNITAAIIFAILFACVCYGFYCFRVSRLDIGNQLHITASNEEDEHYTCDNAPTVTIHYRGIPPKSIRAQIDGQELKVTRKGFWGTLTTALAPLEDGEHTLTVLAGHYRHEWAFIVDTVVPTMELLGPLEGAISAKDTITFYGKTKPNTRLVVKNNEKNTNCEVDEEGAFKADIPIGHGHNVLKWVVTDRAGNSIGGKCEVACDITPPSVEPLLCSLDDSEQAAPKNSGYIFSQRNLVLKLTVKDSDSGIRSTKYQLDNHKSKDLPIPGDEEAQETEVDDEDDSASHTNISATPSDSTSAAPLDEIPSDVQSTMDDVSFVQTQGEPNDVSDSMPDNDSKPAQETEPDELTAAEKAPSGTADDENQATEEMSDRPNTPQPAPSVAPKPLEATVVKALRVKGEPLIPDAKGRCTEYLVPINKLYDGDHVLSITSINGVGTPNKRVLKFHVNSSEKFGEATLYLGATGTDVEELQKRLVKRGYLKDTYETGTYDKATCAAVVALQKQIGVSPDGICGPQVYGAIDKRIYVNLSQYEAKLVTENEQVYTYPICIGVDKHPTPTGWFYIADLAKDPAWLPPNSEWAKDAKTIEPGPDNPLGTRWIGLNIGSIGFHGTPYPDSVGTKASHGCMRMRLIDVEDLYDRVNIGTQVRIFAGDEKDTALTQYWP